MTLLIPVTLFMVIFALGLGLPGDRLDWVHRRPGLLLRVLLGSCLVVPLLALLLLCLPFAAALPEPARLGIALMALCPSAPLILRKADKASGDAGLAAQLQVAAAVAAIVSVPLMAQLYTLAFGLEGWEITPAAVALQVGMAQILPLACGVLVRRSRPGWAGRWLGLFDRLANLLLLLLLGLVLSKAGAALLRFALSTGRTLVLMAVLVLLSLLVGWWAAGGGRHERTTVPLVTSMRNPGLALLFASTYAPSLMGLKLVILLYVLVTVLLEIPYVRWRSRLSASGAAALRPPSTP
jgi:BASS family bile acid:Na+ symporter